MNEFVKYRREFHKYPETGWRELRTSARIAEVLEGMGYVCLLGDEVVDIDSIGSYRMSQADIESEECRAISQGANERYLKRLKGIPGVIAEFDTGRPGELTALRFDIDALPYDEFCGLGYRPADEGYVSVNKNAVHACGHDAHTAIGLGIARSLLENEDKFSGRVRLIFQPAEEAYNGAYSIVRKGHLAGVKNFIAVHMALSAEGKPLSSNTICCGCKDFLSDAQIDVKFNGEAAHPCGASQKGRNALLAAASAALNLHAIAPHEEGLFRINVGVLKAGIAANTIAPNAFMSIEYRGETPNIEEYAKKRIFDILEGTSRAYDLEYTCEEVGNIPSAMSDDKMMHVIQRAAKKVDWFKEIYFKGNVGGSDDASVMLREVQKNGGFGTYVGIGTDTTGPVHNPKFDIDEDAIPAAVEMLLNAIEELNVR